MAKNSLPESMDLLLDTMCNTFGGVMFIAIALSLAVFAGQIKNPDKTPPPVEDEAANAKKLEKLQAEQQRLQLRKVELEQELAEVRQRSLKEGKNISPLVAEVADLEEETKKNARKLAEMRQLRQSMDAKKKHLQARNNSLKQENRQKAVEVEKIKQKIRGDLDELRAREKALKEQLKKIPVKKIHFALQEHTTHDPYFTVVKNDQLCRLGTKCTESTAEVTIKRNKNVLQLFAKRGYELALITRENIDSVLKFNKSSNFLWVIVHQDSFVSFVKFRRLLRQCGYQVYWYVEDKPILYLVEKTDYNASY